MESVGFSLLSITALEFASNYSTNKLSQFSKLKDLNIIMGYIYELIKPSTAES